MSRGDRFKPLFTWRSAVCESNLGPTTRHVALTLALYMSERGDSAHPGPARLAHDTGLHVSTVKEHLSILTTVGWLAVVEKGGLKGEKRRANEYAARIPPEVVETEAPDPEDDGSSTATGSSESANPSSSPRAPGPQDDPMSPESSPENFNPPTPQGERADHVLAAMCEALGETPKTRTELRRWGGVALELVEAGATDQDVHRAAAEFYRRWPQATCTPMALTRHWSSLISAPTVFTDPVITPTVLRCKVCSSTARECICERPEFRQEAA